MRWLRQVPETEEVTAASVAEAMMQMNSRIQPMIDAAEGLRAKLVNNGWSAPAAEALAGQWLSGLFRMATTNGCRNCR